MRDNPRFWPVYAELAKTSEPVPFQRCTTGVRQVCRWVYGGCTAGGGRCTEVYSRCGTQEPRYRVPRLRWLRWRRGLLRAKLAVMRLREPQGARKSQPETRRCIIKESFLVTSAGLRLVFAGRNGLAQAHHPFRCRQTALRHGSRRDEVPWTSSLASPDRYRRLRLGQAPVPYGTLRYLIYT